MAAATLMSVPPSKKDIERARASGRRLARLARRGHPLTLRVRAAGGEETLELPAGGTHRRVRFEDVLRFKENIDTQRRKVLDRLAAEAQDLKMGY